MSGLHDRRGGSGRRSGKARVLAADVRRCRARSARTARGRRRVPRDGRRGRRGAGGKARARMSGVPLPAAVKRSFPLARLTTVGTGGAAEFFARAGSEAELLELLAWAAGGGGGGERRGVGLEPADRRRGRPRPGGEARSRPCGHRRRALADPVWRRRAPARGGRARGPGWAVGDRVRREHPRDGRGRGANERKRLRRRAGARASSGWRSPPPLGWSAVRRQSSDSATVART